MQKKISSIPLIEDVREAVQGESDVIGADTWQPINEETRYVDEDRMIYVMLLQSFQRML